MNQLEKKFYQEIKNDIKDFSRYTVEKIQKKREVKDGDIKEVYNRITILNLSIEDLENFKKIIEDTIVGVIHSLFVSIDGGTAISDHGKALELIDFKTGKPLTEGALYENFMKYYYEDEKQNKS